MWRLIGKGVAALFCLAFLVTAAWPLVLPPDYYDLNGEQDSAVMKLTPPDLYRHGAVSVPDDLYVSADRRPVVLVQG